MLPNFAITIDLTEEKNQPKIRNGKIHNESIPSPKYHDPSVPIMLAVNGANQIIQYVTQ
jgi:hypothetical protein|tara:strand:- start:3970 stop:4146 length:177 start_codon:yes stop_codon:yes gene_type:complete